MCKKTKNIFTIDKHEHSLYTQNKVSHKETMFHIKKRRDEMDEEKKESRLQSVTNALSILRLYEGDVTDIGVSDIARQLGISKATAFRLANTLLLEGFLDQSPTSQKYYLSPIYLHLAQRVNYRLSDRTNAVPHMLQLANTISENVMLFEFFQLQVICVQKVEGGIIPFSGVEIGSLLPLYCSASGKAMLAFRCPDDVEVFFNTCLFAPYTPHTIASPETLRNELARVRQQGYAEDHEECIEGVSSLAIPIFNYKNDVISALTISVAAVKMERNFDLYLSELQKTANLISARMGYTAKRALTQSDLFAATK